MKRILMLVACLSLVASLAVGGSIAYLQDTDQTVNVMTLGNVDIEQHEQERAANGDLVDFTQAKPAYPAVGPVEWADQGVNVNGTEYKVFTNDLKNVVDKIVTVKNTGKSDAFVRTIIAIEAPDYDPNDLIHVNVNGDDVLSYTSWAPVDINGIKYVYSVFTYKDALAPNEISAPSLMQVFLDAKTTNEDVAKFGDTWEILVVSQAVQAAGFTDAATALDTAFGEVSSASHPWIDLDDPDDENDQDPDGMQIPIGVSTADELQAAFEKGGAILLINDIEIDEMMNIPENIKAYLDMNGKTITTKPEADPAIALHQNSFLEIDGNGKFDLGANVGANLLWPKKNTSATIIIKNGTFVRNRDITSSTANEFFPFIVGESSAKVIIEDGYFDGGKYNPDSCDKICEANMNKSSNQEYIIYGGTFVGQNPAWGDEGKGAMCPHCEANGSGCQGTFLAGQKATDTELPAGYTITEGKTADGIPTYTVKYSGEIIY